MMRAMLSGVVASALLLAACGGGEPAPREAEETIPPTTATELGSVEVGKVARAVAIAKEVRAQPDSAASILEEHGMGQKEWGALMVEIAADSTMSAAFQEALGP